jgi:biotin transport system substrate-specific component
LIYDVLLVLGGSALLGLMGQIAFYPPLSPVPVTGQTFAVLLIGALLGPWRGVAAIVAYLLQGALGLPVVASGGCGIAYMLGPTGGYLLGFIVAGWATGWLARRGWDRHLLSTAAAMTIGSAIILLCGAMWLGCMIGIREAFVAGVLPFLPGDAFKIAAAAILLPGGWNLLRSLGVRG